MRLSALLGAAMAACGVQAADKAVFAHFMVGNTGSYTVSDWTDEIGLAKLAHIDGFALNIAHGEAANVPQLSNAFQAANNVGGFKLFFSFDYAGLGAWPETDVISFIQQYGTNGAYFKRDNKPLVSTFEGPDNAGDWSYIKSVTGAFFMPDWSSQGAPGAWAKGTADGLFSWAAWPSGPADMDTGSDTWYRQTLGSAPYMMPVSPWFFTNLPKYNKNWVWRGDDLWYDRWQEVISFNPDYVEIISWNDFGESHYIGPIKSTELGALTDGGAPFNYINGFPHDGWRLFLPYVIDTYKTGSATINAEGVTGWYRTNPGSACGTGGTTGNSGPQGQQLYAASAVSQDKVFFSALLNSNAQITVTIGSNVQTGTWRNTPAGGKGIYHGSVNFNGAVGPVTITLSRSGTTIASFTGASITTSCTSGLENWNAYVGSATAGSVGSQVCTAGAGANNFLGLCNFACNYGFCPVPICTCTSTGAQISPPATNGHGGHYIDSTDDKGLCQFTCSHGYCPSTACVQT